MKKVRDCFNRLTGWIGKKLFPGTDENTGKRWAAWLLVFLLWLAVISAYRYQAMRELRQYERLMDAYSIFLR